MDGPLPYFYFFQNVLIICGKSKNQKTFTPKGVRQSHAVQKQFAPRKMAPDPVWQPAIYFSYMNSNRNSTRIFEEKTYLYTSLSSNKSRQQFPPRKMAPDPVWQPATNSEHFGTNASRTEWRLSKVILERNLRLETRKYRVTRQPAT